LDNACKDIFADPISDTNVSEKTATFGASCDPGPDPVDPVDPVDPEGDETSSDSGEEDDKPGKDGNKVNESFALMTMKASLSTLIISLALGYLNF
jgi:hypothetical protein